MLFLIDQISFFSYLLFFCLFPFPLSSPQPQHHFVSFLTFLFLWLWPPVTNPFPVWISHTFQTKLSSYCLVRAISRCGNKRAVVWSTPTPKCNWKQGFVPSPLLTSGHWTFHSQPAGDQLGLSKTHLRAFITPWVGKGCHNKGPQTECLKQQTFILSQSRRLEVWNQGVGSVGSFWGLWGKDLFQTSFLGL